LISPETSAKYRGAARRTFADGRPHIYRIHDGGKTWKEMVKGLPGDPVNVVREDPVRKGLLLCGTERAVYVSFNDGDDWQPLRLNMPATSIRDLVVHDDDVVVGTHGRSFWILDDVATNPPDGAIINYYLGKAASGPVTLEIFDDKDKLVRRYASEDKPAKVNENTLTIPSYWIRPPQILSGQAGSHRFVWDLCFPPPEGGKGGYSMKAIYKDTPGPQGPMVPAGQYTIKLTVDGKTHVQPLTVKADPRGNHQLSSRKGGHERLIGRVGSSPDVREWRDGDPPNGRGWLLDRDGQTLVP
jgi:hypothetical protein